MNIRIGTIKDKARQAWETAGKPVLKGTWEYTKDNHETVIGVGVGYALGKVIENTPLVGRLLGPLPSLALATYFGYCGHKMAMERRQLGGQQPQ